ncbi:PE domain-containing protein [Rhodococcus sp. X156]|uniref:PE domain-containing protein n=1 Tax=Rhodococcus sp. X156 TaxID=2499145 RepID=UPI000FDC05CC|nr:PE domain-containing protein [Rhodococcus sp. X156]
MLPEDDRALAESSAAVERSKTEWTALKASAGRGELRFEPEAAERCAKACEDAIAKIEGHLARARRLTAVEGFGTPNAGVALAAKFSAKGAEAVSVLKAHLDVLADMRDAYRAAGRAYVATESANTTTFGAE